MNQRVAYWLDVFLALIFGAFAAGAVWVFQQTIKLGEVLMPTFSGIYIAFLPALGGLIIGVISMITGVESSGDLVDVIAGANVKRRILSNPKNIIKPFFAAVSIASNNPVGSQMSTVMLGSQSAAFTSHFFKIPRRRTRMLIACGAAAGFSAAFGSPLSAVAFVIEIILFEFTTYGFILVSAASGSGFLFAKLLGLGSPFSHVAVSGITWVDLVVAVIIGVICPFVVFLWLKLIEFIEKRTHRLPYIKLWGPMAGGLIAGIVLLFYPEIAGPGYKVIERMISSPVTWQIALALLLAKLFSTSAVLGLRVSGGDFAPAMFIGASISSVVTSVLGVAPGSAVMVGVCAMLGSIMHTPLTAILLSVEIIGTTSALVPVSIGVVVSSLITLQLMPRSHYHQKVHKKGVILQKTQFQDSADTALAEVMTSPVITVQMDSTVAFAIDTLRNNNISGLVVIDGDKVFGIITLADLRKHVKSSDLDKPVSLFCQTDVVTATPQTTLSQGWELMRENEIGRLPIVSASGKLIGIVTKRDMLELAARKTASVED
ncbi:MAG: chloride channel protein [Caldisericia bacterium]|nr:chloride channel protein [Caldisericia bacterium]